jgi:hypothetical protein
VQSLNRCECGDMAVDGGVKMARSEVRNYRLELGVTPIGLISTDHV